MARRRKRVAATRAAAARSGAPTSRQRAGWRQTVDSFGGFTAIVPIVVAIVVVGAIVIRTPLGFETSEDPLLGEAASSGPAGHVSCQVQNGAGNPGTREIYRNGIQI